MQISCESIAKKPANPPLVTFTVAEFDLLLLR